jgi:hypothetical protein
MHEKEQRNQRKNQKELSMMHFFFLNATKLRVNTQVCIHALPKLNHALPSVHRTRNNEMKGKGINTT